MYSISDTAVGLEKPGRLWYLQFAGRSYLGALARELISPDTSAGNVAAYAALINVHVAVSDRGPESLTCTCFSFHYSYISTTRETNMTYLEFHFVLCYWTYCPCGHQQLSWCSLLLF